MTRSVGVTKWFSNRKGFGFVAPTSENAPTKDEIFVHQSAIVSEGYRTLSEGLEIEFDIEMDETTGKYKAVNVTAVGGAPIKPAPRPLRKPKKTSAADPETANDTEGAADAAPDASDKKTKGKPKKTRPAKASAPKGPAKPKEPAFYQAFADELKEQLKGKGFDLVSKTTLDVASGEKRIKLGQGGYAGIVEASGKVGEGTYSSDDKAQITFDWQRLIVLKDGAWQVAETKDLVNTLDLTAADVQPVKVGETITDLWGDKPDPMETFEKNGFLMRRIVLTRGAGGAGGGRRRFASKKKTPSE